MEQVLDETVETSGDGQLVERARSGDRAAFDELVRGHFARVYGLLFRMVGNHEDAEDLAQEAFVRAYRSLDWFRAESSFSTWVYRIALHLARDHQRKAGRRPLAAPLPEGDRTAEPAAGGGPSDELAHRELGLGLDRALRRLPGRLRAALALRVFEGLEYEEISKLTGVTPGTARVHVMKARRLLLRWLAPWLERSST